MGWRRKLLIERVEGVAEGLEVIVAPGGVFDRPGVLRPVFDRAAGSHAGGMGREVVTARGMVGDCIGRCPTVTVSAVTSRPMAGAALGVSVPAAP